MTEKHTFSIETENYEMIMALYKIRNFSCVSELVNQAIEEWLARDAGQVVNRIISKDIASVLESTIQMSERRINRILFKLAVSDAELKHVLATEYSIDERYLERIHERSEREIRLINGMLNLNQAIDGQNGVDEL